jgi:hypothetical protein
MWSCRTLCYLVVLAVATAKKPLGEMKVKVLHTPKECVDTAAKGDFVSIIVCESFEILLITMANPLICVCQGPLPSDLSSLTSP